MTYSDATIDWIIDWIVTIADQLLQIYNQMDQQLLDAMKKRKQKLGLAVQEEH